MTPLDTMKALRPNYPTPMSRNQLGALLNAVAWAHRSEGYGVLYKPTGGNCWQPGTGILISRDILAQPDGRIWDALIDAEGQATPTWGPKNPVNPNRWRAPVDVSLPLPPDVPDPPPSTPTLKPYDDALAVEFGQAVNDMYRETPASKDAGMIAVFAMRAWHDYQGGLAWPAALGKHIAAFREVYGL